MNYSLHILCYHLYSLNNLLQINLLHSIHSVQINFYNGMVFSLVISVKEISISTCSELIYIFLVSSTISANSGIFISIVSFQHTFQLFYKYVCYKIISYI